MILTLQRIEDKKINPNCWHVPGGLIIWPLASFRSRLTLSAVGVKRVTSPMMFLICALASMVAPEPFLRFLSSSGTFNGGFMMLGGALSTFGFCGGGTMLGGGMLSDAPGRRNIRGGGIPGADIHFWYYNVTDSKEELKNLKLANARAGISWYDKNLLFNQIENMEINSWETKSDCREHFI